jgi:hypothetical protein
VVVPGKPDQSKLVLVLTGKVSGVPSMPLGRGALPSAWIQDVAKWVQLGAKND